MRRHIQVRHIQVLVAFRLIVRDTGHIDVKDVARAEVNAAMGRCAAAARRQAHILSLPGEPILLHEAADTLDGGEICAITLLESEPCLIAAAPDLLAVCEALIAAATSHGEPVDIDCIKAVVDKAKGGNR